MGKVGFGVGIMLGILARENFNYTMSQKMDDMKTDYKEMSENLNNRIESENKTIKKMKEDVRKFEKEFLKRQDEELFGKKIK